MFLRGIMGNINAFLHLKLMITKYDFDIFANVFIVFKVLLNFVTPNLILTIFPSNQI